MPSSGPKPPARKTGLDQPWNAADPIPAPEAVHRDGESAWALWTEVNRQHEAGFAPTAPMTVPGALPPGDRQWAPTQPGGLPQRPVAGRRPQSPFTLEAALLVARKNNRVCPRPVRWAELFAMLPPRKTARGQENPPAPVIGPAWNVTPPLTKRVCFREHVEWAESAGILEAVMALMQSMREDEWLHMGEE